MRLGGPVWPEEPTPDAWVVALQREGYTAAYWPTAHDAPSDEIRAYRQAADTHGIVIAEVGAWSNPLSPNAELARQAIDQCKRQLELAERAGARCCVNIAGSRSSQWDGPHPDNLTDATFERIVETVQEIIDAVGPSETTYALETMPWAYPDSPESYQALIEAIDRPQFAVHLDPVNLVNSPSRYFRNGELIDRCFDLLGDRIRSCHAKDIRLAERLTVHLDEVAPGQGALDYRTYLTRLDACDPDTPLMLEHLAEPDQYRAAAAHIRQIADDLRIAFRS
ncbi:MAG: sugar phosphate isomerase/epimerase family protein [Anaerolineae bacterium]